MGEAGEVAVSAIAIFKSTTKLMKCNVCFEARPAVVLTVYDPYENKPIELVICAKCLREMLHKLSQQEA